jgi:putative ABC transport system permease protein
LAICRARRAFRPPEVAAPLLRGCRLGLGIALAFLVSHLFSFPTIVKARSPMVAFAVSVAVGLIFGTYPARRAAYMDPIEALRHE